MAVIPALALLACPKCGNTPNYKPTSSNGPTVGIFGKWRKNSRIEVRNEQIYRVS